MNKIITMSVLVATLLATQSSFAVTSTGNAKATATLASSCQISATNVNFGQLNLQAAQSGVSATSSMNLYCTKGSAYTINLAYGGVYGQGTKTSATYVSNGSNINYDYNGKPYTTWYFYAYNSSGQYTGIINSSTPNPGGCVYTNGSTCVQGSTPYGYGLLTGAAKGDTISYKITVPGNDSAIWNSGNSTYANTGTGAVQNFPIKATIQTGTHGSLYPAADTYMDTVTATVSY